MPSRQPLSFHVSTNDDHPPVSAKSSHPNLSLQHCRPKQYVKVSMFI
jgi:hypothetical protein